MSKRILAAVAVLSIGAALVASGATSQGKKVPNWRIRLKNVEAKAAELERRVEELEKKVAAMTGQTKS